MLWKNKHSNTLNELVQLRPKRQSRYKEGQDKKLDPQKELSLEVAQREGAERPLWSSER